MAKAIINGSTSNFAYISIVPESPRVVEIVIGATYEDRCAGFFDKQTLYELIETLQSLHNEMEYF